MSDRPALERISMTIPPDTLRRADRLARQADRSRSWVIAEALRRFELPAPPTDRPAAAAGGSAARVDSAKPRLDPSRRAQLQADLRLTPTERVLAAERTAREVPRRRFAALYVGFERVEDYLEWKKLEDLGLL